jgi:hypothetical protein
MVANVCVNGQTMHAILHVGLGCLNLGNLNNLTHPHVP